MSAETSYSVTQAQLASSQKYPPEGGKAVVLLCGSQWGSSRLLDRKSVRMWWDQEPGNHCDAGIEEGT